MALGAPNLEEIYDLRPNGTWSKKMVESSAEKTIEITMRRWSAGNPYAGPPMPSYSPYAMYGGVAVAPPQQAVWSSANAAAAAARYTQGVTGVASVPPPPTAPSNTSQALDEQANQRLGRLESALLALKPQIEAMVAIQSKQLTSASSNNLAAPRGPAMGVCQSPTADKADDAPELRLRRNLDKLQINTAPGDKAGGRQATAAPVQPVQPVPQPVQTAVVKESAPSPNHQADAPDETEKSVRSLKVARPTTVEIPLRTPGEIPLRSSTDPQSPRSPGRFSAWK